MLADPYYPKYGRMSPELSGAMRRYYDFLVRYVAVLSLGTRDTTPGQAGRVRIEGINTDPDVIGDKVWVITREGPAFETISLINLLGVSTPTWSDRQVRAPAAQTDLLVRTYSERPIRTVWWASPDLGDPGARPVSFTTGRDGVGRYVEFVVPALTYWDLIVLEE
jgi:dextranase